MTCAPSFGEWFTGKVGKNWVIAARKTDRLCRQYGLDVVVVTHARNVTLRREYRALYGDPDDAVRAEMYRVLRDFKDACGTWSPLLAVRAERALEAERNAR